MSKQPTTDQLRRVTGKIMALLSANDGENVRPVFDMQGKQIPEGTNIMGQLMQRYRFDAVRCEILGVTLTVEITTKQGGLQPEEEENQLRYCTASYELFRIWLFAKLHEAGLTPKYPTHINPAPSASKMSLGRKPFIHAKSRG